MEIDTIALNLAYLSYVAASLVPGGLKLRVALVAQSLVFITAGSLAGNTSAVMWNVAFATVNIAQAIRTAMHDSVKLTDEEGEIRDTLFRHLSARNFLLLWSTGQADTNPSGVTLCSEGVAQNDLLLVLDGAVDVVTSGGYERRRTAPTFIGEMSFYTREPASADVESATSIRYRRWKHDDLRNLETLSPDCARALHDALGRDAARKLQM